MRRTLLLVVLGLLASPVLGKDKTPDPHQAVSKSSSSKRSKALWTSEKKKPSKAEREAVFADYGIPPNQRHGYSAEYRVPLSLGGSNAYANIEVLPKNQAQLKHRVQKDLEGKFRRGEISEDEAQMRILNWNQDPLAKK